MKTGDFRRIVNFNGVGSPMLGLIVLAAAPRKRLLLLFLCLLLRHLVYEVN
jgi:hypothetical protein